MNFSRAFSSPHRLTVFATLGMFMILASPRLSTEVESTPLMHERLRVINTFKKPEEVIHYYCARDASGFVWSGLLDAERRAFTLWPHAPTQDTFFVAKSYQVMPAKANPGNPAQMEVDVKYDMVSIADSHGTRIPVESPSRIVTFTLQRVGALWKIVKPEAAQIAPVVLEAKFPLGK